jgi:hypothetical protein
MNGTRAGRPEAAAAIWRWGEAADPASRGPSAASLRLRGSLQALLGIAIGAALWTFVSTLAGVIVTCTAGGIGIAALASPCGLFAWIERGFSRLGELLGSGMTAILMPLVFYLIFLPLGISFRRGRRDAMRRFFDPQAPSYWSLREGARAGSRSRRRQY